MKITVLYVLLFFFAAPQLFSQENGAVALSLPVRNSLKFNKQVINPTFSFVREQNTYISFSNKRQTQFEGSPNAYIFGYAGRIRENNGAGITLFQRDYGVFTNFGGVLNFAHNIVLTADSNLTFGLNVGAYKSGLNTGNVVTNDPDPALDNVQDSFLLTVAPGINYGMTFIDIGVSVNNLISYSTTASKLIEENPEKAFQFHIMYTGYMDSRGFFYDSKFSALVRSEFNEDKTTLSGLMMLSVPKGFWGQVGYNTFYGASVGVGFNITEQIALEYNYEQSISDLYDLGSAHEITLAYRFNKRRRFKYGDDDKEVALFQPKRKPIRRASAAKPKAKQVTAKQEEPKPVEPKPVEPKPAPVVAVTEELKAQEPKITQIEVREIPEVTIDTSAVVTVVEPKVKTAKEEEKPIADSRDEQVSEEKNIPVVEPKEEPVVAEQNKPEEIVPVVSQENQEQQELVELAADFNSRRDSLITKFEDKVDSKQENLEAMKEENDLSEKGIYVEPRPFKSISAENLEIDALKLELDDFIEELNLKITELETVYITVKKEEGENSTRGIQYFNTIQKLKAERLKTIQRKENLEDNLQQINVATEIERKRRIKRALYDDDQDRFVQDRAALKNIVETTALSSEPLTEEDFDLGEIQTSGIQILKDVKNTDNGYYLVIAVHSDVEKRNEILRKIVSTGEENIDFFYDVNTSKYYIYYKKFDDLNRAQEALKEKGTKPYNGNMTLIKIE